MPSPFGHSIISSSIFLFFKRNLPERQVRRLFLFSIIIGLLPDIDLVLVLIMNNAGIHRSITHTFLFVLVAALSISLILYKTKILSFKKAALLTFSLLFMHIVCDFFTIDVILHNGVMLFYPFSKKYIPSPLYLFMGFDWRSPLGLFGFYMIKVLFREFLVTSPILVAAIMISRRAGYKISKER